MTTYSISVGTDILKRLYPDGIAEECLPKSKALAVAKKDTNFDGEGRYIVLRYTPSGGASSVFGTAQSGKSPAKTKRFFLQRFSDYALESISTEMLRASASNKGAIVKAFKFATEAAMTAFSYSLGVSFYGNGGGAICRLASGTVGTDSLVVTEFTDVLKVYAGMSLQTATTDGTSGSVKGGSVTVLGVQLSTGTIQATAAWTAGIATVANTDYVFRTGDFGNKPAGLGGYCPASDPTSGDNFLGVDRSANPLDLAGLRITGSGGTMEEVLIDAVNQSMMVGAQPDTCMMHPKDFANLSKARQSKVVLQNPAGTDKSLGFSTFQLDGPSGTVDVIPDTFCPKGTVWMFPRDIITLASLGEAPGFLDDDGNGQMLREYNADSVELRVGGYYAWEIDAPKWLTRITL